MMKRIRFGVLYVLAMIGLAVAVDYALFWRYVTNLEERQKPRSDFSAIPGIPEATLRRLGAFRNEKLSAFTRFAPAKPEGVIRIGVFGGSHTNSAELDESSDFPSRLAGLLAKEGIDGVEILNFGSAFYRVTQSYILWNEVGRYYGLDAVLVGPRSMEVYRDTRFNPDERSPYYLHSRFVAIDEELRLIDVIGATHAERFRRYFSFLTPWRYLRFDRNDPPFLAAALPEGRAFGNPFYYDSRSEQDEAADIQRRLLRKVVESGTPVVLGDYPRSDDAWQALTRMGGSRFCAAALERPVGFPYLAPGDHNSPTGDVFIARQYLSLLTGRPVVAPLLRTAPLEAALAPLRGPTGVLADYEDVRILVNGVDAGRFATRLRAEAPSFLHDRGIRAMLAVKSEGDSVVDGIFLAFRNDVDVSAPARLVLRSSDGEWTVSLAKAPETRNELRFGVVSLPGFRVSDSLAATVSTKALAGLFEGASPSGTLRLLVGERVVLEGPVDPDSEYAELRRAANAAYRLRSTKSGDAAADRGSASGIVEMVLRRAGETVSVPLAGWRIEHRQVDPSESCPPDWKPILPAARLSLSPEPVP